jgi:hypothetical protein
MGDAPPAAPFPAAPALPPPVPDWPLPPPVPSPGPAELPAHPTPNVRAPPKKTIAEAIAESRTPLHASTRAK